MMARRITSPLRSKEHHSRFTSTGLRCRATSTTTRGPPSPLSRSRSRRLRTRLATQFGSATAAPRFRVQVTPTSPASSTRSLSTRRHSPLFRSPITLLLRLMAPLELRATPQRSLERTRQPSRGALHSRMAPRSPPTSSPPSSTGSHRETRFQSPAAQRPRSSPVWWAGTSTTSRSRRGMRSATLRTQSSAPLSRLPDQRRLIHRR